MNSGGLQGVRDIGLLESAVFRPQTGYYEDLLHQAAALMESLGRNHAFIDGNKRIALAGVDAFLRSNGFKLEVDSLEAYEFITRQIAARKFRVAEILGWLRANTRPIDKE